ncbi:MAG: hypothetical protein IJ584_00135 [Bacteroidales bacterium]|nr:hypothetical protein [Bacteroidales bacterium]MBR1868591.1 hypothetical protein [Bacteroidales bacterium]
MKALRYTCFLAIPGLLTILSCQREVMDPVDPYEGKEEVVLSMSEVTATRSGASDSYDEDFDGLTFGVTTEDLVLEGPETRAISAVTTIAGGNVVWGAIVGTSPATLWSPVRKAADSNGKVSTGHYVSTSGGTTNTYYVCNAPNASNLSLTTGGAVLSVGNTGPANGTDIVVGKAVSSSHNVPIQLDHIYARTGTLTLNAPAGVTVSSVSWRIASHGSDTGYAGTYDIDNGTWTSSGALSSTTFTGTSNFYLIPGLYDVTVRYTARFLDGSTQYGIEKTGTVNLVRGKVNNISASIPDELSLALYVAWASQDGVGGVYQEVPAHGDIYVGGHGTLEARLYTLRNGALDTYTVVPNASVTWSIPNDSYYISIDPSTGVLTGLRAHGTPGTYGRSSCYVNASYTAVVDGESVTYNAATDSRRALVNVVADAVESYGTPTLQLVYDPNPIVAEGGTSTPTLTYSQVVAYASGRTETVTGTVTSGITWSGSSTGFTLNSSTGVVTAEDNYNIPSYTYGTPQVTSFTYTGSPISAEGGQATPAVTYRQSVRERRAASSSRGITVTARATVNGKQGTASCVVNQEGSSAVDNTTYETDGGALSYSGSATGFTVNFDSGVVTAVSNTGTVSTTYANPVVSLVYNPDSFGSAGGTAVPALSYSQAVTTARPATSTRSITVTVSVSRHGLTGTGTATVSQSGAAAQSDTNTITSGGSVVWSMDTATGFAQNASNGNVVVAVNNTASSRSTHAWATVTMNGKSASSEHILISQEAGTVTTYEYELIISPASAQLEVGYTRTYVAKLRTWTLVNGSRTGYSDTTLPNSSLGWSSSDTSKATIGNSGTNAGMVTGRSVGSVTITATYTPSGSSQLTATANLLIVSGSNNWDDSWDDEGEVPLN